MTLATEYTDRYSTTRVLQVTNPDSPGSVSNGTARLAAAATDATGYFNALVGVTLDLTDARHVAYGVEGVDLILQHRMDGSERSQRDLEKWKERLRELGLQTTRFIPTPISTSRFQPSEEPTGRPNTDRANFGDMLFNAPNTNSGSSDGRNHD